MASSGKSSRSKPASTDIAARVAAQLAPIVGPGDRLVVGLSGGIDSVALLDALRRISRPLKFRLAALHVNHQLSPGAGRWSAFCRRLCRAWNIPYRSAKVRVPGGKGIEGGARAARYEAFSGQACDYVVLAHHRDDQVETFLLQLLRGAGVKGLAAMPLLRRIDDGRRTADVSVVGRRSSPGVLRPLLDVTREEILDYAKRHHLEWIEDESNADVHFRRNYLRHEVLPLLARRFPSCRATIARAVRHLADADAVLDEIATADGVRFLGNGTLAVEGLRRLSAVRARNLLRYFLEREGVAMPAADHLAEALRQLVSAKQDAGVEIRVEGATLRRYEGRVHVVRSEKVPRQYQRRWHGEKRLPLPELGGVLTLGRAKGRGISLARLREHPVTVRLRQGGERLQPDRGRPRRSLKNLFQEGRLPPWERDRLPLIFQEETLVWVPGIGIDSAFQAKRGEPSVVPAWTPAART